MAIIGAVFARGGSKGIPGKNLSKIKDKTLTKIALENLHYSKFPKRIYLCALKILEFKKTIKIHIIRKSTKNSEKSAYQRKMQKKNKNAIKI